MILEARSNALASLDAVTCHRGIVFVSFLADLAMMSVLPRPHDCLMLVFTQFVKILETSNGTINGTTIQTLP